MNKKLILHNILKKLFGNLCDNQKSPSFEGRIPIDMIKQSNDPNLQLNIENIIKQYNLKCEKIEMDIEGEKYIIENWKTDAGQMMIQKVYPANHEPKSVRTGVIGNGDFATPMSSKLDELKRSLYQSIQDERYEDAAKYRDLIKNFK